MADLVSGKCEGSKLDAHLTGQFHASRYFAFSRGSGAAVIAEYDVRERMASYLLGRSAGPDPIDEVPAKKQRIIALVSAGIMRKPVRAGPSVVGPDYLGVLDALHHFASVQKKMADYTPRGGNLELLEQRKEAVDHYLSFYHAGSAKSLGPKQVQRSPDQLEVETDCQDSLKGGI